MTPRKWTLTALTIPLAVLFIALGFWQLSRRADRIEQNKFLASRRFAQPVELTALPADTAQAHFRRVKISGNYDYANEFVLTLRGRDGSPGVHIFTPLKRPGTDTVVLVNRGWVYAADGITADLNPWREPELVSASGFVETFPTNGPFPPPTRPRAMRRLDRVAISRILPYPVAPYYVVLTDTAVSDSVPPRVNPAPLDEGPHRNYAIQWFSFAAISIIGLTFFIRRT